MLDPEGFELIKKQGDYKLIIDETITLVEEQSISQGDFKMLEESEMFQIEPTNIDRMSRVKVTACGLDHAGVHEGFLSAVHGEHVFRVNNSTVVFVMPPEKFSVFNDVTIMTYLFEGSETHCWLQLHKLDFEHKELEKNGTGHKVLLHDLKYSGADFKSLITICDDKKLNEIGKKKTQRHPLSRGWYKEKSKARRKDIKQLKNHTRNFFMNKMKVKGPEILWTCPKDKREDLKDRYFDPARTTTWLAYNFRATNEYMDRHYLAYLLNVFPRASITNFCAYPHS